jgi:hypothetical protein
VRSKRIQKRKKKLPTPIKKPLALPDPFSAENPELVEQEEIQQEWEQDMCPCCRDRLIEIEYNKLEGEYLALRDGEKKS